jgi:conjugal transfer/type IV secretion protein DotA/TraY
MSQRNHYRRSLSFLAGLLPLFWSAASFAGGFNAKPSSDDMILGILSHTVGPLISQVSGVGNAAGTITDITLALKDINELVLILGGLLLTYIIGAGIMKTAHEGEPLGQRWSSMWVPLKAALGAALILPVPSLGGLSAAQGIVVWLLTFGIGAGDALWAQSLQYIAKDPVGSVEVNPIHTGLVAEGIIDSQVCELGINETADNYFPGSNPVSRSGPTVQHTINPMGDVGHVFQGYDYAYTPLPGGHTYALQHSIYQWTADSGGLLGELSSLDILPTACGKVAFVSGVAGSAAGYGGQMVNTVGKDNASAMGALISNLKPISQNLFEEKKTGTDYSNFVKAINTYDQTMQNDIQNAANTAVSAQVQKYVSAAKVDGFATAGEWFWDLVEWNHIAQKTANNLGDATGMNIGSFFGRLGSSHIKNAEARAASFVKENGSVVGHVQPTKNADADIGGIFAEATPMLVSSLSHLSHNPLIDIRDIGTDMELAGGTIYALNSVNLGVVSAVNGGDIEDIPGVGSATNAAAKIYYYNVNPVLMALAGILFVEGFFLSFVVPLIPFMVWVAGLLGFLLMAFEMIVAAPLWAIMHMHPDGHEMVGMASQGYKIALAIITRPFLMVLGLIGGYALFDGFTKLVTPMISAAVVSGQGVGGGFTGPFDMIGAVGVYVTLTVIIAYEAFKLVFVLPEKVMAWASSGHNGYNEGNTVGEQKGAHDNAKNVANQKLISSHEQGMVNKKVL